MSKALLLAKRGEQGGRASAGLAISSSGSFVSVRGIHAPPPTTTSSTVTAPPAPGHCARPDTCSHLGGGSGLHTGRHAGQEWTPATRVQRTRAQVPAPNPTGACVRGRPGFETRMPVFQTLDEIGTGWCLPYLCYQKLNKPKQAR